MQIITELKCTIANIVLLSKKRQKREKNQIQDHVKKRKECAIVESGFTSRAKNATMTEYPGGVHLVNRLQREFNYLQPCDMKKVNV